MMADRFRWRRPMDWPWASGRLPGPRRPMPRFRRLMITRAVLGMGESFNWPCASRIVANAFPPSDRSLASGIFNSGAALGSLIARY